jgi:asparagine synthase (glutamine-hydrolysing)
MSGIVAAHGPFDPRMGQRMLERLAHRGPDGEGSQQLGDAWLGHRHLAIVDPQAGSQPLHDAGRGLWLVGDGHVANHRRLRRQLGEDVFDTRSDHEVALRLFARDGVDGLDRLWGTFALAIAGDDGRFAVVRDTLGVVPLYWARRDGTALFASELKAFDEDWRPDVEPFPPGHAWTGAGGLRAWRRPPSGVRVLLRGRAHDDPPDWVFDAVRDAVVRAVEQAMVARVPVGAFLSGGLDSSIVVAIAAQRSSEPLRTFAAGLPDSSDLSAARLVAEHVGAEHRERVYTPEEAIAIVPEVIRVLESFDPLLVHSAVPNHLVARLASEHVKAVLIGEGADELFAGYAHYAEVETGDELQQELVDTLRGLHIGGLQRVDRVTSANALEPRIPFLDLDVVELALALPPAWKLADGERPEKWLLRRAFEGWLPEEVLWRPKEQFGQGTGMDVVLREHFGALVGEAELERDRHLLDPPVRTREELAYFRILAGHLSGIDANRTIGRFVDA